jgi:nucleoid-associated protein YgaU
MTRQYTVKGGDTLSGIAARELGDGLRWTAIYSTNKPVIDAGYAVAKSALRRFDPRRHEIHHPADFIRPGLVLELPATPDNQDAPLSPIEASVPPAKL